MVLILGLQKGSANPEASRSSEPGVRRKAPRCLDMPGALQDPLLRLRHSADAAGGRPLLLGTHGTHDTALSRPCPVQFEADV